METKVTEQAAKLATVGVEAELSMFEQLDKFMHEGGIFMWIILAAWVIGIAIALERITRLYMYDVNSSSLMNEIKKFVLENNVQSAISLCSNTKAVLPKVLKNALKRANQSRETIQDAVDASTLEVLPIVEKRLTYLGLLANISTLIGLLGTIYGLIESFAAVAGADPAEKAKLLAMGISKAMNTTALGLISAISLMIIHTFLSNKAEKILGEVDEYAMKLVDLIGTKKGMKKYDLSA